MMNDNFNSELPITIPDTFKPVKRNRWAVLDEGEFAEWYCKFPKEAMLDPCEWWAFWKQVLQVGEEEGVCRITKAVGNPSYDHTEAGGQRYIDWVEHNAKEHGELIFAQDTESCCALARLCYFDLEGNVVEAEVGKDLGDVLCQMRPDVDPDEKVELLGIYQSHNPIRLGGGRFFSGTSLHIQLQTDIWFPRLWGWLEGADKVQRNKNGYLIRDQNDEMVLKPQWYDVTQWFDNRELALRHTPRLNHFLQRVKQLALDHGAQWSIQRQKQGVFDQFSERLWDEDGIFLDPR